MVRVVRRDLYFEEPGRQNTGDVVEAVAERCEATGIGVVVAASTYGYTALKLVERLKGKARVVSISEHNYDDSTRRRLTHLGVALVESCPTPVHDRRELRDALYLFGQGVKVAVEVAAIAAEKKLVEPYEDVIAVGGTSRGADAAIVVRATPIYDIYSEDPDKRMEVREVIAMPLRK